MKTRPQRPKRGKPHGSGKTALRPSNASLLLPCLVIAAAILAVIVARIGLLAAPLERDEGEYGYLGQLLLQGIPPYGAAANMKLPGTYMAYALFMAIFGQTASAIHIGLLLVDAASAALVYGIGARLFPADLFSGRFSSAAFAAAGAFSVLSIGPGVLGLWAHATHFVVVFALAATLTIMQWSVSRNLRALLGSGLLYGMAFLMKQPGILFAPLGAICIVRAFRNAAQASDSAPGERFSLKSLKKDALPILASLTLFSVAVAVPFAVVCLWLWRAGVFSSFWFWVVTYGREYGSMATLHDGFQALRLQGPPAVMDAWALWLLAAAGAAFEWRARKKRASPLFLLALLALSAAAVCPGLYFRGHYFVVLLPAIALLAGAFIVDAPAPHGLFGRAARTWIVAAATALPLFSRAPLLFEATPLQASKMVYSDCPFVEAIETANYIAAHTSKDARIAVFGSEPEIYFYAGRRSASPYIYMYGMTEVHPYAARMQDEFIADIEKSAPEYIVLANIESSWLLHPGTAKRMLAWMPAYWNAHYEQVGLADMLPTGTNYYWDAAARRKASAHHFLSVLKRKAT